MKLLGQCSALAFVAALNDPLFKSVHRLLLNMVITQSA